MGMSYVHIIRCKPVDISTYFVSRRQHASKVPRLQLRTMIQFGSFFVA
jgi:hypothetical protein